MFRMYAATCALMCTVLTSTAFSQSGPMQIDGTARKVSEVPAYMDSDGKKRAAPISVANLAFPMRVLEETPTGMARIRNGDTDAWIALEDFKVNRNVKADCNFVMATTRVGADRGANEGCAGAKNK